MEVLLCASCRRRLLSSSVRVLVQQSGQWLGLHTSSFSRYNPPKLNLKEAPQPNGGSEVSWFGVWGSPITKEEEGIRETLPVADSKEWGGGLLLRQLPNIYLKLSKSRLTALVVLTSLAGYTMAPAPFDMATLCWAAAGTGLCSAAANTINQWVEVPYDSLMVRTRNRVLVRKMISPHHALLFGFTTGTLGISILWFLVNPLTAALGLSNILLYAGVYTPLKRVTIANTWVGSVVGALPPIMGWSACTGTIDPGAMVMAGILFAWQFAHFNALSWSLKADYSRAGYRMMAVTDPGLCRRVAMRYSIAMIPICTLAPVFDVTTWWFALDSLPLNAWLCLLSWRFYQQSDFKSSRKLFHFTLFHLPLLMGLLLLNKKHWYAPQPATQSTV